MNQAFFKLKKEICFKFNPIKNLLLPNIIIINPDQKIGFIK